MDGFLSLFFFFYHTETRLHRDMEFCGLQCIFNWRFVDVHSWVSVLSGACVIIGIQSFESGCMGTSGIIIGVC